MFSVNLHYPRFVNRRALPGIRPGEIILYLLLLLILLILLILLLIGLGPTGKAWGLGKFGNQR